LSKQICLLKIEKMPRGTYLTETEEGKIMALHGEGCGLREIAPHIRRQKMKTVPNLTMRHKQARLEFAQRNMNRNWSQVHIPFLFYWMFIKSFLVLTSFFPMKRSLI
jgi:hypothetical protein